MTNAQSGARLYLNEAPREGSWLLVRAIDPRYRRDAIGARVTVDAAGLSRTGTVGSGFSYLSSSDPRVHFGLGPVTTIDRLVVHWLDGRVEEFAVDAVDRVLTVVRGEGRER